MTLKGCRRIIYDHLRSIAIDGIAQKSILNIAADIGYDPRSVERNIPALERAGLIRRDRSARPSRYEVRHDVP